MGFQGDRKLIVFRLRRKVIVRRRASGRLVLLLEGMRTRRLKLKRNTYGRTSLFGGTQRKKE
jgi:hypothetical protein